MRRTALTGLVAGLALVVAAVLLWPAGVGASSTPAVPVLVPPPPLAAPSPAVAGGAPPEAPPVRVQENCTPASPCVGPQGGRYHISPSGTRRYLPRN